MIDHGERVIRDGRPRCPPQESEPGGGRTGQIAENRDLTVAQLADDRDGVSVAGDSEVPGTHVVATAPHLVNIRGSDAGAASLIAAIWMTVLAVALSIGMILTGVWRAHARAGVAADLGALAGAGQLLVGPHAVCRAVRAVVIRNSARLVECRATDVDVRVVVAVVLPTGFSRIVPGGHMLEVRNQAHATIEVR